MLRPVAVCVRPVCVSVLRSVRCCAGKSGPSDAASMPPLPPPLSGWFPAAAPDHVELSPHRPDDKPEHHIKTLSLIRHAEGIHNVAVRESTTQPQLAVLFKDHLVDAPLSDTGVEQCVQLRESLGGFPQFRPDLVVVSPLTRTLQTATLVLGSPLHDHAPPFVAHELVRERVDNFTCNARRPLSEVAPEFPGVDFSLISDDHDPAFGRVTEDNDACAERCIEFLEWLLERPEQHVAVVTHSVFLLAMFRSFGHGLPDEHKDAFHSVPATGELRTVHLTGTPSKKP